MCNPIPNKRIRDIAIRATAFWCCPADLGCCYFDIARLIAFDGAGADEGGFVDGGEVGLPGWIEGGELGADFLECAVEDYWGAVGVGLDDPVLDVGVLVELGLRGLLVDRRLPGVG